MHGRASEGSDAKPSELSAEYPGTFALLWSRQHKRPAAAKAGQFFPGGGKGARAEHNTLRLRLIDERLHSSSTEFGS
jgi:hypothetical protein